MEEEMKKKAGAIVIVAIMILGGVGFASKGSITGSNQNQGREQIAPEQGEPTVEEPAPEKKYPYELSSNITITIRHNVENRTVSSARGMQKIYTNGTHAIIDMNHPLAGKTLNFNVTLRTINREGEEAEVAREGDGVTIDYVGRLDSGEVFSTSLREVAEDQSVPKAEMFRPREEYSPMRFVLGSGQVIPGLEEAVKGMEVNQSKEVEIPPEKAYGSYKENRIQSIPLEMEIPKNTFMKRFVEIPTRQLGSGFETGDSLVIPGTNINSTVIKVGNQTVTLELLVNEGDKITTGLPFNSTVVAVHPQAIEISHQVEEGQTVQFSRLPWNSTVIDVG